MPWEGSLQWFLLYQCDLRYTIPGPGPRSSCRLPCAHLHCRFSARRPHGHLCLEPRPQHAVRTTSRHSRHHGCMAAAALWPQRGGASVPTANAPTQPSLPFTPPRLPHTRRPPGRQTAVCSTLMHKAKGDGWLGDRPSLHTHSLGSDTAQLGIKLRITGLRARNRKRCSLVSQGSEGSVFWG